MDELARAETVDVEAGKFIFDVREQVEIPLLRELGMMTALHQHLRAAERDGFLDFFIQLGQGDDVGVVIFFDTVERAKLAIHIANIGVIDIAIHDVSDDVIASSVEILGLHQLPPPVRECPELFKWQSVKSQCLGGIDALTGPDFLQQLVQ